MFKALTIGLLLTLQAFAAQAEIAKVFFLCNTESQVEYVVESSRQSDMIPGVFELPFGCMWVHDWGMPRQGVRVVQLLQHWDLGDKVVWSARVELYDGREMYSAGEISFLAS